MRKQVEPKAFIRMGGGAATFITRSEMERIVTTNSKNPEAWMKELDEGGQFTTFLATYRKIDAEVATV